MSEKTFRGFVVLALAAIFGYIGWVCYNDYQERQEEDKIQINIPGVNIEWED
tara:strand:- start:23492 stop:23647 length:156 start_codon:yes stop_codon:yes gene_type:complete